MRMRGMPLKVVGAGWILGATLAAVGCHGRTSQELQVLINQQAQKVWAYHTSRSLNSSSPATYSDCREATPADPLHDGQAYEAICTERLSGFVAMPDGLNECYSRVSVRTVGLWDEGQSPIARLVAGGPVLQFGYLTDDHPNFKAEWAAARAGHRTQPCPVSRQRVK